MEKEGLQEFEGGALVLIDRYPFHLYSPLGSTRTRIVETPGGPQTVVDSRPDVQFDNHYLRVTRSDIARAMVEFDYFYNREGYVVDHDCLPEFLKSTFGHFDVETKRKIVLALIDGKDEEHILGLVKPDTPVAPPQAASLVACPVCGVQPPKEAKNPKASLIAHIRSQHPGYKGIV